MENENNKNVVIFIHGLGADDPNWWGSTKSSLQNNPVLTAKYDIRFFRYKTDKIVSIVNDAKNTIGLGNVQASLEDLGKQLKDFLTNNYENYENIKLFGHSMGGLIISSALPGLQMHNHSLYKKISSIAFAGTPLGGSSVSSVLKIFFNWLLSSQTKALSLDSPDLNAITAPLPNYLSVDENPVKKTIHFFKIIEDEVVKTDTERYGVFYQDILDLNTNISTLSGGHAASVQNLDANSENFKNIQRWITDNTEKITKVDLDNKNTSENNPYILVVGGANIEYIYKTDSSDIKLNSKQNFNAKAIEYGGSGLNYSLRLMASGLNVFPVLPIGKDLEGEKIVNKLKDLNENLVTNDLQVDDINTIESLILATETGRTILSQEYVPENKKIFYEYLKKRIEVLKTTPSILMIGHIHSDKNQTNNTVPLSTLHLIKKYHKVSLIYLNLGKSQLTYGFEYWEEHFKKIGILQLNLEEIKYLFNQNVQYKNISLNKIIKKFQELNINVIITLDDLGALCIVANDDNVIYASELHIEKLYKDKTGAGDAFASGIVHSLITNNTYKFLSYSILRDAMIKGRLWATYACKDLGGASNCPTLEELCTFQDEFTDNPRNTLIDTATESTIDLIDKVYLKCNLNFYQN